MGLFGKLLGIKSNKVEDGFVDEVNEHEEVIKSTFYSKGNIRSINEYESGEKIKSTFYSDGEIYLISKYENDVEVKSINYSDGVISSIYEYENGEEVKSTIYTDGKISMVQEYENGEEIKSTIYTDGKILMIKEYKDDILILTIIYKDGNISKIGEMDDNDELSREIIYINGKVSHLVKYENDKEIIISISEKSKEEIYNKYKNYLIGDKLIKLNNSGYVYILVNSSLKDMVKIGKTTRNSEERAKEISSTTGVPTPFVVAYDCHFNDCSIAEKHIHELLEKKNFRTAKNREFFNMTSKEAIEIIMEVKEVLDA